MWNINTIWFEISIILTIFTIGGIFFGHFEEHKPKWKRVMKVALFLFVFLGISILFGRLWFLLLLALFLLFPIYIHAWWLPKNGINGLTGEPKEKYYQLIKKGHT